LSTPSTETEAFDDADVAPSPGLLEDASTTPEVGSKSYRGPDRRSRPTPRFSRYTFLGGRRRRGRRDGENENSFVDRYSPRLLAVMLWIGLMNIGDSFFTLHHIQAGAIELNPVAAWMLTTGRTGFVLLKASMITIPLIVLTLHKNFSLARVGIWTAAGAYTVLFAYHIALL
jgi:hypothetical protein